MTDLKLLCFTVASLLSALLSANSHAANIVTNGGFEDGGWTNTVAGYMRLETG